MVWYEVDANRCSDFGQSSRLEWVLPNGRGGYAMGTVSGANTRRYHGHFVPASPPPASRYVLLANVEAAAVFRGTTFALSANQYVGAIHPHGYRFLQGCSVGPYVEWRYRSGNFRLTKRLISHRDVQASTISYRNDSDAPIELVLKPLCQHKFYHDTFRFDANYPNQLSFEPGRVVMQDQGIQLVLEHEGAERAPTSGWFYRFEHQREADRGLDPIEDTFCPAELRYHLAPGEEARLVAHIGERPAWAEFEPRDARRTSLPDKLRDAADKFVVDTPERATIIAGYPWFTDWGRDTMISLDGLCLVQGRFELARRILTDYAGAMKEGLIPNRFVEKGAEPEYNTVDGSLWFVNALYKTLLAEWNVEFASQAMGWIENLVSHHVQGTMYGIKVDPADGLLTQGEKGVQLTWMDAKVGDWVCTPRHGKPVEVAGLWINALRVAEWLAGQLDRDASKYVELAEKAEASFEPKFWNEKLGHYHDTADPADATLRPNYLIAMGLPFSPLSGPCALRALETARRELLTPYGIRTLGPSEQNYRGRFEGPLAQRDAAYHQGTAWPWLLGVYCAAVMRLEGDRAHVRELLNEATTWLTEWGIGGIAEVADGDPPHRPDGCPWQAWSVAEVLRTWTEHLGTS